MKKLVAFVSILLLIGILGFISAPGNVEPESVPGNVNPELYEKEEIKKEYIEKYEYEKKELEKKYEEKKKYKEFKRVVYGPAGEGGGEFLEKIKKDCSERDGVFKECGSFCNEGDICIQSCAYTCEKIIEKKKENVKVKLQDKENKLEIEYEKENADGKKIKYKYKREGGEIEIKSELEIEGVYKEKLKIKMSNGEIKRLGLTPEEAIEYAFENFRGNESNLSIEIEERHHKNVPSVVYKLEGDHPGRFLGIFKMKARYEASIDAETGEVVDWKGPWWAFLISGEPQPAKAKKVTNFKKCVEAGGEIMESHPRQCSYENKTFVEEIEEEIEEEEEEMEEEIDSFEDCLEAGNPVMESLPRQCEHDGIIYVEIIEEEEEEEENETEEEEEEWESWRGYFSGELGEQIVEIDSKYHKCSSGFSGALIDTCLLVNDKFFLYDIEGFTYEEGQEYRLRIKITELANPPADGSSLKYELIEVIGEAEEECENNDGIWTLGMNGEYYCNDKTSDGGNSCSDSSECESVCLAPEGLEVGQQAVGECWGYISTGLEPIRLVTNGTVGAWMSP